MPTNHKPAAERTIIARRNRCAVCDSAVTPVIALPGLPITDTYCREPIKDPLPGIDQRLLYCPTCGHGQLETLLAPSVLYGSNYCFRTSASATARKGTEFFLSVLNEVVGGRRFRCVLDIGCNDLYLLSRLAGRAEHRVGIDPIWEGREDEREDKSIIVFGGNFEDIDLGGLPVKPDLVVCSHTLEHIYEPRRVLETLMSIAVEDALFLFEVPGFDGLIQRLRFDQVFHQHAQYFTLASFLNLLAAVGGQHVLHRFNYHHWGAMVVAFLRGADGNRPVTRLWTEKDIELRYRQFQGQMTAAGQALALYVDGPLYGYGAAQMLPVLGYHMGTDFSELTAVLDDDPAKDGIGYWNLPVKVMPSDRAADIADATVLLTAVDNVQPIMTKLLAKRPRHIIIPLNVI